MGEKRYYWIKLKETFFKSSPIKKMRKIAGGDTYVIIYLKMMLLSMNTGGMISYEGEADDFVTNLATDIDEEEENVSVTLGFLDRYKLLEYNNEQAAFLPEVPDCIGSEVDSAERVRKHRQKIKALQCNTNVTENVTAPLQACENVTLDIRDKILDIRDIYSDSSNDSSIQPKKARKRKQFKPPTLEEVKTYAKSRGNVVDAKRFFDYFEAADWHDSQGKPVKNWKQKMITWESRSNNSQPAQPRPQYESIDMSQYDMEATLREAESQRRMDALLMEDNDV